MMKDLKGEFAVGAILVVLLLLVLNPFGFWMPTYMAMSFLAALVVAFGVFANFIWREQAGDERERLHRMFADRAAFLAGSGVILVGIVVQDLSHSLTPWLPLTLAIMLIAKVAAIAYSKIKL